MPSQLGLVPETRSVAPPPGRSITFKEDSMHQPPRNRDNEQLDIGEHTNYGDCLFKPSILLVTSFAVVIVASRTLTGLNLSTSVIAVASYNFILNFVNISRHHMYFTT